MSRGLGGGCPRGFGADWRGWWNKVWLGVIVFRPSSGVLAADGLDLFEVPLCV